MFGKKYNYYKNLENSDNFFRQPVEEKNYNVIEELKDGKWVVMQDDSWKRMKLSYIGPKMPKVKMA